MASGQPGHAGAPGQSLAGGRSWKGWRRIHTWGVCSCPADGEESSLRRSESRRAARRRIPAPTRPEGGQGTAALPGPAPAPAQRADCLPAPDVRLRAAAQRGFSALLNDRSVPFPSGRSRCASRPSADPGSREPAGRRPEKGALCAGHGRPFPVPLEMSKGSRTRQSEGSAAGGVKLGQESGDLKAAGNNSPGKN